MQILKGIYNCTVDEKGRIMFPSVWKRKLDPIKKEGFILKKSLYYGCLEMYTMTEWNKALEKIEQENQFLKRTDDFKRFFLASHREVKIDNAGRLQLPKDLKDLVKINKDVVLAAAINKLEIWDKSRYDDLQVKIPDNIEELVNQVMGNKKQE